MLTPNISHSNLATAYFESPTGSRGRQESSLPSWWNSSLSPEILASLLAFSRLSLPHYSSPFSCRAQVTDSLLFHSLELHTSHFSVLQQATCSYILWLLFLYLLPSVCIKKWSSQERGPSSTIQKAQCHKPCHTQPLCSTAMSPFTTRTKIHPKTIFNRECQKQ